MSESYVRGSMVFFTAAFADRTGAPVQPDSATLYLVFRDSTRVERKGVIFMTVTGNVAEASWDSSVAAPGLVTWSVKGQGANAIVQDGSLTLTANAANQ